ncbi:MAG: single-stranded-DNA-specific exonuclease RecJ [Phormidium sp.]
MQNRQLPNQRWEIYPEFPAKAQELAIKNNLSPLLTQVILNRGIETEKQVKEFLDPESMDLPDPLEEFSQLGICLELLENAIAAREKIAICGDYDADGMTSTALLLRALKWLGAQVDCDIPDRQKDGYGINQRLVEKFHREGVRLILTVDNGIAAYDPIKKAQELGLKVIVTDHHEIPENLPPANAILNPKQLPESSPYSSVAGVGVAYILAVSLAKKLGKSQGLVKQLLELCTLGTIADMVPLKGVNRRWVKRGLQFLPNSDLEGVKALIEVTGINQGKATLKPDDIGFKLGPRINALGRIDEPQIVIDLLTTDDIEVGKIQGKRCDEINKRRQQLCEEIQQEAIDWCEKNQIDLQQERVLVIVQPNWHHGVIGIVASRLVERYGVPVFIGTYEEDGENIRGSARGIPEFHVFQALEFCKDLLGKFGGHKAAGGFSLPAKNLPELRSRLREFAHKCLQPEHLKPLLKIDAQADFHQINLDLYRQIDVFHPCDKIENPLPVFWTPNVQVIDQRIVKNEHLKLTLAQNIGSQRTTIKAIAWRWSQYYPLPGKIDIAYRLQENIWNGNTTIEIELLGVRNSTESPSQSPIALVKAEFYHNQKRYTCGLYPNDSLTELRIRNAEGKVLAIPLGKTTGLLGKTREDAREINILQPPFSTLVEAAQIALEKAKW